MSVCQGCQEGLSFCFLENKILARKENSRGFKQAAVLTKGLQPTTTSSPQVSPTKALENDLAVVIGNALGELPEGIGLASQYTHHSEFVSR